MQGQGDEVDEKSAGSCCCADLNVATMLEDYHGPMKDALVHLCDILSKDLPEDVEELVMLTGCVDEAKSRLVSASNASPAFGLIAAASVRELFDMQLLDCS